MISSYKLGIVFFFYYYVRIYLLLLLLENLLSNLFLSSGFFLFICYFIFSSLCPSLAVFSLSHPALTEQLFSSSSAWTGRHSTGC